MNVPIDTEEHFIEVPLVARPRRPAAQAVGISLAELEAPFSDGFVSEDDAATGHQLFDIAVAQREAKVEPDAMTDYFGGEAMATVSWDRSVHQRIMRYEYSPCTFCWLT